MATNCPENVETMVYKTMHENNVDDEPVVAMYRPVCAGERAFARDTI